MHRRRRQNGPQGPNAGVGVLGYPATAAGRLGAYSSPRDSLHDHSQGLMGSDPSSLIGASHAPPPRGAQPHPTLLGGPTEAPHMSEGLCPGAMG